MSLSLSSTNYKQLDSLLSQTLTEIYDLRNEDCSLEEVYSHCTEVHSVICGLDQTILTDSIMKNQSTMNILECGVTLSGEDDLNVGFCNEPTCITPALSRMSSVKTGENQSEKRGNTLDPLNKVFMPHPSGMNECIRQNSFLGVQEKWAMHIRLFQFAATSSTEPTDESVTSSLLPFSCNRDHLSSSSKQIKIDNCLKEDDRKRVRKIGSNQGLPGILNVLEYDRLISYHSHPSYVSGENSQKKTALLRIKEKSFRMVAWRSADSITLPSQNPAQHYKKSCSSDYSEDTSSDEENLNNYSRTQWHEGMTSSISQTRYIGIIKL